MQRGLASVYRQHTLSRLINRHNHLSNSHIKYMQSNPVLCMTKCIIVKRYLNKPNVTFKTIRLDSKGSVIANHDSCGNATWKCKSKLENYKSKFLYVCVCMHAHVCVCVCVCMHACTCVCVLVQCMHTHLCVCVCACLHVHTCMCACPCVCVFPVDTAEKNMYTQRCNIFKQNQATQI